MGVRFPVELGQVMQFARAVGESDARFLAAANSREGQVPPTLAPPTFVQSAAQWDPDYWLRPRPGRAWHGSAENDGFLPDGAGVLHAEQHFTYHRHIQVGDVLTRTERDGETWEKQGRTGLLRFSELISEFRDDDGELVVTVRAVRVITQGADT